MADGHAFRWEVAFLLTAPERDHGNGRAGSRIRHEHRAIHVRRQERGNSWPSVRSGAHVAGARRRPGRRPRGGGHDAAGCRRPDAQHPERRVASRERRTYSAHADNDREVRAGRRCRRRDPRSDPAMPPAIPPAPTVMAVSSATRPRGRTAAAKRPGRREVGARRRRLRSSGQVWQARATMRRQHQHRSDRTTARVALPHCPLRCSKTSPWPDR